MNNSFYDVAGSSRIIELREVTMEDSRFIYNYANNPTVTKYTIWNRPKNMEETKRVIQEWIINANKFPRTRYDLAIVYENNIIGTGRISIDNLVEQQGSIGYLVDANYWGKGIATITAKMLVSFGMDYLKLNRINAKCRTQNIASQKILDSAGFSLNGVVKKDLFIKGKFYDAIHFGITNKQYEIFKENFSVLDMKWSFRQKMNLY